MASSLVRRSGSVIVVAVLGGALAIGAWAGGHRGLAVALGIFYVVCCVGLIVWSRGRGDAAAIIGGAGDERQVQIDLRSTACAGAVTIVFCVGGAVVDLARGSDGNPWVIICGVSGAAYICAFAVFRNRA
jgi:hypothetical protein